MLHKKRPQVAVIGGDLRHAHMANLLAKDGFTVYGMCLEKDVHLDSAVKRTDSEKDEIANSDIIILPLPVTVDKININAPFSEKLLTVRDVFTCAPKDALILGGMFGEELITAGEKLGLNMLDYLEREELAVLNSIPTAEGAVAIAMRERASTVFGSVCMLTGYGRVSKVLAKLLVAMGANVIVAARKPCDIAWAKINGCKGIHISKIKEYAAGVDILFNTVPAMILDEEILSQLAPDALVIDLASKPGGVDFETAKKLGIKTIWALSLPGKVAPISAGEMLKESVINILTERGYIY